MTETLTKSYIPFNSLMAVATVAVNMIVSSTPLTKVENMHEDIFPEVKIISEANDSSSKTSDVFFRLIEESLPSSSLAFMTLSLPAANMMVSEPHSIVDTNVNTSEHAIPISLESNSPVRDIMEISDNYGEALVMDIERPETVQSIESKIDRTYKFAIFPFAALALIALTSLLGTDFLPKPLDKTLFWIGLAGTLGLSIDKWKQVKLDGES